MQYEICEIILSTYLVPMLCRRSPLLLSISTQEQIITELMVSYVANSQIILKAKLTVSHHNFHTIKVAFALENLMIIIKL
jgi:hypothetical protein